MTIPKEIVIQVSTNLDGIRTQLSVMSTKVTRAQHLMKELVGQLIEIENDLEHCDIELKLTPQIEGEQNAREQQGLGSQEEATGPQTGGVQREKE